MLPLVSTRRVTANGSVPSRLRASSSPPTVSPMSWVSSATDVSPSSRATRFDDVGLQAHAVAHVGLVGEAEAEEVERRRRGARARSASSTWRQSNEHDGKPCSTSSGSCPSVVRARATSSTHTDAAVDVKRTPRDSHSRTSSAALIDDVRRWRDRGTERR